MAERRQESDALGMVDLPAEALWGSQTQRAVENFRISGATMPREFIIALARIKQAAAHVHKNSGELQRDVALAIVAAAREVVDGKHDNQFPVDVFQTGSGTSSNMNVNEVIARRASQLLCAELNEPLHVHPNDHVNRGQSSNDVVPSAAQVAAAVAIHEQLIPALRTLRDALEAKAVEFDGVVKVARTHLMDAVPIRLGQEFRGYVGQIDAALQRLQRAMTDLCELPLGGTAVGTGLNASDDLAGDVCIFLYEELRLPFREAKNHFAAQASADVFVQASAALRGAALAMGKIANDIRLMASGPRCGLGELKLAAHQPGSSIMPGKVNPVMCEMVVQVACQVVGCDAAIAAGATGGVGSILELSLAWPMIAFNALTQIKVLANAADAFAGKCVATIDADAKRCAAMLEQSLAMVTALTPDIGYDRAAEIAHEAYDSGKTIREVCKDKAILDEDRLEALLEPRRQTGQ
ncbi:MAG: aspartate ammonia-lyase [Planctomycetes bacterium]|jgi:fumarate hydratase class II|nr:class II fumarate hydratase [Phycisphaerae bacterium]NBB94652.1 aspartate ammonia-lyase [Planctomycetota bacterium]